MMDDFEAINRILTSDYSGLGFDTTEDALQELRDHLEVARPDYIDEEQEE